MTHDSTSSKSTIKQESLGTEATLSQGIVRSGPRSTQEFIHQSAISELRRCLDAAETPHGLTRDTQMNVRASSVAWDTVRMNSRRIASVINESSSEASVSGLIQELAGNQSALHH